MEYILVLLIVALLNGAIAYIDGLMEGIIPLTLYAEQYMSTLAGVDLFQSLFDIVFGFGVSLIVLKFLKKGFETYKSTLGCKSVRRSPKYFAVLYKSAITSILFSLKSTFKTF